MADLGKVAVTDGGNYSANTTYEKLTFVHYLGDVYMTLKTVTGITPTDDGVNYRLFCKSAELATATKAGIVLPDGTTIYVEENGVISAKKATQNTAGIVKGSDDVKVGADGGLSVDTTFQQATELANIIAGEALASVLGKVSKAIAVTMSLDQNALLKNMMSGIDVNNENKVPTSAYIHTLVERIGMGETLTSGGNLTAAFNELNRNLKSIFNGNSALFVNDFHVTPSEFIQLQPFYYFNPDTLNGTGGYGVAIPLYAVTWFFWLGLTTDGYIVIKRKIDSNDWSEWQRYTQST